jgi:hypothetical protein
MGNKGLQIYLKIHTNTAFVCKEWGNRRSNIAKVRKRAPIWEAKL